MVAHCAAHANHAAIRHDAARDGSTLADYPGSHAQRHVDGHTPAQRHGAAHGAAHGHVHPTASPAHAHERRLPGPPAHGFATASDGRAHGVPVAPEEFA